LALQNNSIDTVISELGSVITLQVLDLSANLISTLPTTVQQLTNLEELALGRNQMSIIPSELMKLTNLRELDVSNNLIAYVPLEVGKLNLKCLKLEGNPLRSPPIETLSLGHNAVMEFLRSNCGQEIRPNYRLSLMIVGHEKAGKTSTLQGLMNSRRGGVEANLNIRRSELEDTINIVQLSEQLRLREDDKKPTTVTFNAWDFNGAHLRYTSHLFFRPEATLYLLLWNMEVSFEDARLEYWLQTVSRRAPRCPIILVGTHSDLISKSSLVSSIANSAYERFFARFPGNIRSVVSVSWTKSLGFDRLWRAIESSLQCETWLGECFPTRYLQLEESLRVESEKKNPPVITLQEFNSLCARVLITPSEFDPALALMNKLGALLALPGDSTSFVLDVRWIIRLLSSLFNLRRTKLAYGTLKHSDLDAVWPDFSAVHYPFMIDLLGVCIFSFFSSLTFFSNE